MEKGNPALTCKPDFCQFGNEFTVVGILQVSFLNTAQRVERLLSCPVFSSTAQPQSLVGQAFSPTTGSWTIPSVG